MLTYEVPRYSYTTLSRMGSGGAVDVVVDADGGAAELVVAFLRRHRAGVKLTRTQSSSGSSDVGGGADAWGLGYR